MKIRVIIYSETEKYIKRILKYYENHTKGLEHFDLHLFSNIEKLEQYLDTHSIDILLVDEHCNIEFNDGDFLWAYLADENSVDKIRGIKAIGKYQRIENLFQDILRYYAEQNNDKEFSFDSKDSKVYLFQSASGGAGSTTIAMAYATYLAESGKKVLYLNLEPTGIIDEVFEEHSTVDFGDVLYVVKSSEKNLAMKLRSLTMQSTNGVYYFNTCKHMLDLLEMNGDELQLLLAKLKESDAYDTIVVDKGNGFREIDWMAMNLATDIVFVLEDTDASRKKFLRQLIALEFLDQQEKNYNVSKMKVVFNYCNNKMVQNLNTQVEMVGGIPFYRELDMKAIVNKISKLQCMSKL